MSRTRLQVSRNPIIMPLLAGELENEIPNLDIYGSEKKLLDGSSLTINQSTILSRFGNKKAHFLNN